MNTLLELPDPAEAAVSRSASRRYLPEIVTFTDALPFTETGEVLRRVVLSGNLAAG